MNRLVEIISNVSTDPKLVENVSITIGRLGLACPEVLAPDLERFVVVGCGVHVS